MQTAPAPTLTVQTPSGLAVTLTLGEYCGISCVVRGAIPARGIEGAASCFAKMVPPKDGASHCIRIGPAQVGLAEEQAALVTSALASLQSVIDQRPDRQAQILRERREVLAQDLVDALDQADSDRAKAWERGDEQAGVQRNGPADLRAEEAMAALAAFDSQHPEVLTGILEEKDRRAAEAMFQ